jgi:guanosine-3',5'-bis(diphosphate) 3'-pyrophosphohydrolase
MDFELGRSPAAAHPTLRYVEEFTHRVKKLLVGSRIPTDPVAWLVRAHRSARRDADANALRHGYDVAEQAHRGQLRKSGEAYIGHPLEVAQILAELGMDTTTLVAALLHDTVEDTNYTMGQLRADFGSEVALLVDGVTKFEKVAYGEAAEVETYRKMIIAAGIDVRVLIIKLADRLHNMRTLDARSPASRIRIARATEDVLIPLCDRLGIQALKRELEDSVLAALEPEAHALLEFWVAHRPEWTAYTDDFMARATALMRTEKIGATVVSRPRHLYTIWKDTFAQGYQKPHELHRIAIIVTGAENDCYAVLGAVHSKWRPVTGRFKDFLASPKNNLYRSLHTTVIGPEGRAVEILIRTEAMHHNAEYGIAAAFRYVRRGPGAHTAKGRRVSGTGGVVGEHLEWLRRLVEWQRDAIDPVRFIESLRCDLADGQVHVFVNGARLLLAANSTPVDVAYALSPEVGDRCVAATVNGQLTFLSSPLVDGDVVEIHTAQADETRDAEGKPIGPSPEWLTFVRTPHAQLHIERRLGVRAVADPEMSTPVAFKARVRIGRSAIGMELYRRDRVLPSDAPLITLADELGYPDVDQLLVAVADHDLAAGDVAQQLIQQVDNAAIESGLETAIEAAAAASSSSANRP